MNKLTRISATVASSLALVAGFASAAGASPSIDTTGYNSTNKVSHQTSVTTTVDNDNDVHLTNNNPQTANTGEAEAERNTTGGDVASGNALNNSTLNASVHLTNSSPAMGSMDMGGSGGDMGGGSISTTGADSLNKISSKTTVTTTVNNDNDVHITNNNDQSATSGSVSAEKNTTVGNVSSGDASNTSNASFTVSISN